MRHVEFVHWKIYTRAPVPGGASLVHPNELPIGLQRKFSPIFGARPYVTQALRRCERTGRRYAAVFFPNHRTSTAVYVVKRTDDLEELLRVLERFARSDLGAYGAQVRSVHKLRAMARVGETLKDRLEFTARLAKQCSA